MEIDDINVFLLKNIMVIGFVILEITIFLSQSKKITKNKGVVYISEENVRNFSLLYYETLSKIIGYYISSELKSLRISKNRYLWCYEGDLEGRDNK